MKHTTLLLAALLTVGNLVAQNDTTQNIRQGWTFGVLPCLSYDADLGFQYGALTNIYYFGDGSTYPEYLHSLYAEASYTTTHYGLFRLSYDSKFLIPNHRLSVDMTYLPDKMCDFYGFNGYQTLFHPEWVENSSADYITRGYYKMQRDIFRLCADLQGTISGNWKWNIGAGILNYTIDRLDFDGLNKNKDPEKQLLDTITLYDRYVSYGLISDAEKNGGFNPYLHAGATYDSRDRQQNPRQGIHADAFFHYTAAFGQQSDFNSLLFNASWRHYLPLANNRIIFAYRLGTQLNVAGHTPFYVNTYLNQLYLQRVLCEGLGGGNSLRGIMRNRILSDGFAFANVELRLQVAKFKIGKEHFYIGLNPFLDGGMVVQKRDMSVLGQIDSPISDDFDFDADVHKLHLSAGCGLKVAMNENFILSVDWATALNAQDNGKFSNIYVKMGYMF